MGSTDRKGLSQQAVEESTEAVERLRSVVNHVLDGIITIDSGGTVTTFNPAAERIFGYPASEVIGQNVKMLMPEPYHGEHDGYLASYLHTGQAKIIGIGREVVGQRKDGSTFPMDLAISVFRLGESRYFTGIVRDITERKKHDEALRSFSHLLMETFDPALMWDLGGPITYWNKGAERLYGFTAEEAVGRASHDLLQTVFPVGLEACEQELKRQRRWEGELKHKTKGGRWITVDSRMTLVEEPSRPLHALEVNRDITQRKEAEERMRSVVNHVVDGIISIDEHGTVTTFNPAAERIFGYAAQEVIGQNIKMLMPEPYHSQHDGYIANYLQTGQAKIIGIGREVVGRRKDGTTFPMDLAISVFRLGQGRYFTGIVRDITERKRAEEELREAEERMRSIVDHVIDGIITIDEHGTVESYNPAAEKIFGYTASEVLGKNVKMLMPEPFHAEHDGYLANYLRSGEAKIIGIGREVVGCRKDGSTFPMDLAVSEFHMGQRRYFTGIVRDISERRRAEAELRLLDDVIEQSTQPFAMTDLNGRILRANGAFERLTGYDGQELHDLTFQQLTPERWHEMEEKNVAHTLTTGQAARFEKEYRKKDGSLVPIEVVMDVRQTEPGQPQVFCKFVTDIGERKRAEEELHQTAQELARSNLDLEQFAYVASHDLQEPLRAVGGCVQVLKKRYQGQLDSRADELIAHTLDGVNRMQTLIDDLLTYSRVGTRGKVFEPCDCDAMLNQALANLETAITETGAIITHDQLPVVAADAAQLTQLFQNFVGNAIKFRGQQPPRIHIAVCRDESGWVFSVKDNGIGMQPEYFERIFVIFQRLHTRTEYPGTGIGLAICKKIVERHGGHITVESQPGHGSTFTFTLSDKGGNP